jgi:hypothetical protein
MPPGGGTAGPAQRCLVRCLARRGHIEWRALLAAAKQGLNLLFS